MAAWTRRDPTAVAFTERVVDILSTVPNFAAVAGDEEITLTWDAATGAPWKPRAVADTSWTGRDDSVTTAASALAHPPATLLVHYRLQRSDDGGLTYPHSAEVDALTFSDDGTLFVGLTNGVEYWYRIRAVDYYSRHGEWSEATGSWNGLSVTPRDVTPPSVVIGLAAAGSVVGGIGRITLSEYTATDNHEVVGYEIERDGVLIDSTSDATYLDSPLDVVTVYSYRMRAYDLAGNRGPWSDPVSASPFVFVDYDFLYPAINADITALVA